MQKTLSVATATLALGLWSPNAAGAVVTGSSSPSQSPPIYSRTVGATGELSLDVDTTSGDYSVSIDGVQWLKSSPITFISSGICYASGTATITDEASASSRATCAPLYLHSTTTGNGTDPDLGFFQELSLHWSTAKPTYRGNVQDVSGDDVEFITRFKTLVDRSAIVFEQNFPLGVSSAAGGAGGNQGVSTHFPAFEMSSLSSSSSSSLSPSPASAAADSLELFAFVGNDQVRTQVLSRCWFEGSVCVCMCVCLCVCVPVCVRVCV